MNIPETYHFDKDGEVVENGWFRKFFLTIAILLVAVASFGVGRLTKGEGMGVSINYSPNLETASLATSGLTPVTPSTVYASSKGTRYYYPNCKSTISAQNKINFASPPLAEAAGYTLASNCTKQ